MSYEDLCKQHVDKYLRGVEDALQRTALEARVHDWRKKIGMLPSAARACTHDSAHAEKGGGGRGGWWCAPVDSGSAGQTDRQEGGFGGR